MSDVQCDQYLFDLVSDKLNPMETNGKNIMKYVKHCGKLEMYLNIICSRLEFYDIASLVSLICTLLHCLSDGFSGCLIR